MRRVVTTTGAVAAAAVLALAVVGFVLLGLGPRTGAYQVRTVLSSSMRGTVDAGDVVVTRPLRPRDVEVGDVITYRAPVGDRRIVTHRVVEVVEKGDQPVVRTRGDAVAEDDPWLARLTGDTAWRMTGRVPDVGYVLAALQDPRWRTATTVAAPMLLALLVLRDLWAPAPGSAPRRRRPDLARVAPRLATATATAAAVVGVAGAGAAFGVWADGTSAAAAYETAVLAPATSPATAAGTCTALVGDQIVVSWAPSPSAWAEGYEIVRSGALLGAYSVVGTVSGRATTSFTDGPVGFSSTYHYKVRATKAGWRSAETEPVSRTSRSALCL